MTDIGVCSKCLQLCCCVTFVYEDMTSSKLVVDKTNNTIAFNNYSTKLVSGSKFGEINISTETLLGIDINKNNSISYIT